MKPVLASVVVLESGLLAQHAASAGASASAWGYVLAGATAGLLVASYLRPVDPEPELVPEVVIDIRTVAEIPVQRRPALVPGGPVSNGVRLVSVKEDR
jgi:hypothetical protein